MSLILDALQQAEHERQAQRPTTPVMPVTPLSTPHAPAPAATSRTPLWLLAGGALLAAALAGLWWFTARPVPPRPAVPPQPSAPEAPRLPTLPVATAPVLPAEPRTNPADTRQALQTTPVTPPPFTPPAAAQPTSPAPTSAPSPEPSVAPATAPVLPGTDALPAEVRAQLPALQITGHTYSDNPTLRTLMIDGRMLVEGQALAPGLRLERIGTHQAVFNLRGTRFSVDY